MRRLLKAGMLVTMLISANTVKAGPAGAFKDVPELQALQPYVGVWNVAVASGKTPILDGEATAEWILDGRYVQQTASLTAKGKPGGIKFTTLMTYDPVRKAYRSWTFLSNGSSSQSDGVWDSKLKTMTWVSHKDESGNTSTTKADFSLMGIEKLSIVVVDPAGKVVTELNSLNMRRK